MTDWESPAGLANKRAVARAVLWFEQVWPAVWPALGVLGAFGVGALLDWPALLAPWPRVLLFPLVAVVAAGLLWWGLRRVRRPDGGVVDRRLERASGLTHRPLAALADRPAVATPEAEAVWRVHRARMRTQVGRLRLFAPRPGLPGRDLRALRMLVLLALAAAAVVAGRDGPHRLLAGVAPGLPEGAAAPGTVVQAWLTPPGYTGLPPVFLQQAGAGVVRVPSGSRLTVSVTGGRGAPSLAFGGEGTEFTALDAGSWQAEREIAASGALEVMRAGGGLASWPIEVIPDHPPTIAFAEPPGVAVAGGRPTLQTRMAWRAEDDYGIAGVQAEVRLAARPDAAPIVAGSPIGGSPRQARGAFVRDLTAHPWAGLPVLARMTAKDAAGQTGTSGDVALVLPERTFTNLAARALIAIRKQLSVAPEDRQPARQAVDAVADRPDLFEDSSGIFLNLRAVASLLARGRGQEAVDEAQDRLWRIALALEEGASERTARALEQARQALRDALEERRAKPDDPARQAELERRNQELREAIQRHLEALSEQARRENGTLPFDPASPQMSPEALDRMAQEMEKSAREGRMDDAKREMAELERLLEQLQNARPEHGEQREQRNAERRQQGRQQQDAVQDMVRREGDLLDSSRNRAETRPAPPSMQVPGLPMPGLPMPGQQAPGQQAPGDAAPPGAPDAREQDGRRQRAMRRALGELMQRFGDLTGQIPAPLGEADAAMREAGQALADGRDPAAAAAAQRAIEALQKGGREMGQQMARQFGTGQQPGEGEEGQEEAGDDPGGSGRGENAQGNRDGLTTGPQPGEQQGPNHRRTSRRDPLGRPLQDGASGSEEAGDVRVPDAMEEARTRALQEELRRRGAERTRPQPELDYIDRLLKPF